MFKIKQILKFDENYNIIRYEEYQGNKLIYWENLKYHLGKVLEKETEEKIYYYESYPHKLNHSYNKISGTINVWFYYMTPAIIERISISLP